MSLNVITRVLNFTIEPKEIFTQHLNNEALTHSPRKGIELHSKRKLRTEPLTSTS